MFVLHVASRKWVSDAIVNRAVEPRSFHAACTIDSKLVVVGGRGLQDQHFGDVHVFNIGWYLNVGVCMCLRNIIVCHL